MPQSFAPIIAGSGGVLLEAPDTLPESGTLALAVNAAGKMSSVAFPATTRETLGLATTDSPTFAGATFSTNNVMTSGVNGLVVGTAPGAGIYLWNSTTHGLVHGLGRVALKGNNTICLYAGAEGLSIPSAIGLRWGEVGSEDLSFYRDAANTLALRNSTNGQKSRIYKTYTSATSGEWLEFDAVTNASNFDIAACIGSAGGTARGIRIGGKDAAGTFTPLVVINGSFGVSFTNTTGQSAARFGVGFGTFAHNSMFSKAANAVALQITGFTGQTAPILTMGPVSGSSTFHVYDTGALEATTALFAGTVTTRASAATAGTAPIKVATGTLMTTPEAGAIEYDGTNLYFTDSGGTRRQLAVV